jgi:hypothetical protein
MQALLGCTPDAGACMICAGVALTNGHLAASGGAYARARPPPFIPTRCQFCSPHVDCFGRPTSARTLRT